MAVVASIAVVVVAAAADTEGLATATAVETAAADEENADGNIVATADCLCRPAYRDLYEPDSHCFCVPRILDPSLIRKRLSSSRFNLIGLEAAILVFSKLIG